VDKEKEEKKIVSFNFSHALVSVLSKLGDAGFGMVQGDQCSLVWSVWHFIQECKTSSRFSTTFKGKNILHSSKYGTRVLKSNIGCHSRYMTLNSIF